MQNNEVENEEITFNKGCDEWLAFKQNTVKESSFLNYKFKVNKHLRPDLGSLSLDELAKCDMNEYIIKKKKEKGITDNILNDCVILLKSILRFLKRKYRIDFNLDFNYRINGNVNEIVVFNEKERQKLLKYLIESQNIKNLGVLISLYSGLRIGEVCGLKWKDIDFENKVLNVRRTIQRVYLGERESKIISTTPKSKKSIRKIPLAKILIEKLKPLSTLYSKEDYIINGLSDKYTEPLVYRYTYQSVLKECNVPYRKYHCLRHTFATRCIRVGMDIKSLSEVLGHSNIGITLSTYVHSSYEVKKKYIDKL